MADPDGRPPPTAASSALLPEPALSFTLPSLHDGLALACRVYHPPALDPVPRPALQWAGHTAVFAHPYAPLGGSYDDPAVETVAATLLRLGFLVVTFNFRYMLPHAASCCIMLPTLPSIDSPPLARYPSSPPHCLLYHARR